MAQSKLEKLAKILQRKIDEGQINYTIPDMWNAWNYQGVELRKIPSQELLVNPYRFYFSSIIKNKYLTESTRQLNRDSLYLKLFGKRRGEDYSFFMRLI